MIFIRKSLAIAPAYREMAQLRWQTRPATAPGLATQSEPPQLTACQWLRSDGTGVRHEALCNRVEVEDLLRWAVAAAW